MTDAPPDLFAAAAGQLQPLVTRLEHRLNQRNADRAAAGQADLLRRWCKLTAKLYDPAFWASAREAYDVGEAATAATHSAKQTAAAATKAATDAQQSAKERAAIHRRDHPTPNI